MPSNAGNSRSSAERIYHIGQESSISPENQLLYHSLTMTDGGDENPSESSDGKDEGDEIGSLKTEDFEVQMDLTDDLLHMVFIA